MTDVLAMVKAVLAPTATRWLDMTEGLPVDLLNRPPAVGEWSASECLIHLLDTEHIFPARAQALKPPFRKGFAAWACGGRAMTVCTRHAPHNTYRKH